MYTRAWIYVVITGSLYLQKCVCDPCICVGRVGVGGCWKCQMSLGQNGRGKEKKKKKKDVYLLQFSPPLSSFMY